VPPVTPSSWLAADALTWYLLVETA
jgi:hypothetical protein